MPRDFLRDRVFGHYEVLAVEQLHHRKRRSIGVHTMIEDLHDVRATNAGGGRCLMDESGDGDSIGLERLGHELNDDLCIEREVLRDPDAPHPTSAERAL
jgi:hypothetical protein